MAATAPPYPRANQSEETVLWTWPMTRSGNQVRVLNPNTPRSLRRRTRQPAFLLVRVAVGLPGLEPGTSSLSATHREPLCAPPFPQVTSDRRGRSYRVYRPAVTRSPADGRLYCGLEPLLRGILEECWKPAFALPDPKQTGLRLDPERYLRYYNTERAHTGRWTKGRTQQRSSRRPSCGTSNADASPQLGDRTQRLIVGLHRRRP
jgi:hypothetical protein